MIQLIPTMRVAMMRDRNPAPSAWLRNSLVQEREPEQPHEAVKPDRGMHALKMSAITAFGLVLLGWWISKSPTQFAAVAQFERISEKQSKSAMLDANDMTNELLRREVVQAVAWDLGRGTTESELNQFQQELRRQIRTSIEQTSEGAQRVLVSVNHRDPQLARRTADAVVTHYFAIEKGRDDRANLKRSVVDANGRLQEARDREAFEKAQLEQLETAKASTNGPKLKQMHDQLVQAIDEACEQRESLKSKLIQETNDLPATPGLVHVARKENDSLAHQAIKRLLKDRADLVETLSEQHPAVLGLDRRIRNLADQSGIDNPRTLLTRGDTTSDLDVTPEAADLKIKMNRLSERIGNLKRDEQKIAFSLNHLEKLEGDLQLQQSRAVAAKLEREKIEDEFAQDQKSLSSLGDAVTLQRIDSVVDSDSVKRVGPNRLLNFAGASACWLSLMGILSLWSASGSRKRID